MAYKVSILGLPFGSDSIFSPQSVESHLVLRIISFVVGSNVALGSVQQADLVLVYPYIQWESSFRIRSRLFANLGKFGVISQSDILARSLGLPKKRVLVICPENLDRSHWERFGWMLRLSSLPRLTFWPASLDAAGVRFPYWYNYVQWPEFPRDSKSYDRFGMLYELDRLMQPLPREQRDERAVVISSHDQFPRREILSLFRNILPVDVYGGSGRTLNGSKLNTMRRYKYCLTPENSLGFGYCTEKVPESWMAGCIPIGVFAQPFSDFNPEVLLWDDIHNTRPMEQPLLTKAPDLRPVVDYIARSIGQL